MELKNYENQQLKQERDQTKNSNCWLMIDKEDLQAKLDEATKGRASADVPLKKEVKSEQMRNRKWSKEEEDILKELKERRFTAKQCAAYFLEYHGEFGQTYDAVLSKYSKI